MQIVIDIPERTYKEIINEESSLPLDILCAIRNGTPLSISADGTLTVTVEDATKIGRVLVQDNKHNGGLFYADCD